MRKVLSLLLALPALTAATTIRRLEDAEYFSNSYFKFSKCIRVKIPQNNDDDGNAYFYNGAYRSQTIAYASYFKCDKGCDGTCDPTTAYVAELDGVVEQALGYSEGYCNACANNCRRRLEEEGEEEQQNEEQNYQVNCNTCATECKKLNGNGSNGSDESGYLECQYSYTDNDGLDYYSAPTCSMDGGSLVMGLFYDDECTIKKSDDESGFSEQFAYNSFRTVESICMNCEDGVCDDIADGAMACMDGKTVNGEEDDMGVCKTYKRMSKEWSYAKAKKKSPVPIIVFSMFLVSVFVFLAYTYYVRHKNANTGSTKTALLEAENQASPSSPGGDYAQSH